MKKMKQKLKKNKFSNALSHHCTGREGHYQAGPKGPKPARRAADLKLGPGGPPKLLVFNILIHDQREPCPLSSVSFELTNESERGGRNFVIPIL